MITQLPNGVYQRSGDADYYAILNIDSTGKKTIYDIGYTSGSIYNVRPIIDVETNAPFLKSSGIVDPLGHFLILLYSTVVFDKSPDTISESLMLDDDIVANDVSSHYSTVKPVDFLVLTGAKDVYYKDDNGVTIDLGQVLLNPLNQVRPLIPQLKTLTYDATIEVIKFLGLKGYIKILFAKSAITFDHFVDLVKFFFPEVEDRKKYIYNDFLPYARNPLNQTFVPMFSTSQLTQLEII